ncbi:MAG: hypothetical protein KA140_05630 [Caldisericia bacterium]|nr:hypothetical protein [Caldisericia bacterium]
MRKLLAVAILVAMTISAIPAMATVGPVRVELNMIKPKYSHARANQVTSFKVYMRYNVNIKIHDWIKVWFPSSEAVEYANPEDLLKNICDGLPKIDENIDNPRFLPNKKFFEKYPNSKLATKRQLFTVAEYNKPGILYDNPEPSGAADWSDVCGEKDNKRRIVKDPSGLGCWMLGTVMPAIPVDDTERKEWSRRIGMSISIGYNPCDCQPFSMTSTCTQRMLNFIAPLEVEAWRKGYNSIDLNTSSYTGIVAPATPGRYRVSVATEPEPEPVESESFILPCSDISDVTFEQFPIRKQFTVFSVSFMTSEGGALDKGMSTIKLKLPKGFSMTSVPFKNILVNDVVVKQAKTTNTSDGQQILEITSPVDVDNFGKVKVDFLSNPSFFSILERNNNEIMVSTSSEGNFIKAEEVEDSKTARMVLYPAEEYANADIFLTLPLRDGKVYQQKTEIEITFDNGFVLPDKPKLGCFQVNGLDSDVVIDKEKRTITLKSQFELSKKCIVSISSKAGIVSPQTGIYDFEVKVGDDDIDSEPFDIFASKSHIYQLELSKQQAAMSTEVSFIFRPSSQKPIKSGEEIGVEFPKGSTLPYQVLAEEVSIDSAKAKSVRTEDRTIWITLTRVIDFWKPARVQLKCFVTNPREKDDYFIKVRTRDGIQAISDKLTLIPAPLVTKLIVNNQQPNPCESGWYGYPPTISFECLNPEADIFFWYNGQLDKAKLFDGAFNLMPECEVINIGWSSSFNGDKEEPKSQDLFLDTDRPYIRLSNRSSTITNQPIKILSGQAEARIVSYFGDEQSYVLIDSVFVRFNGNEERVFEGGLVKKTEFDKRDLNYSYKLPLNLGLNKVEVVARSLACNETIRHLKIILDTTPPQIEMVSCPQSYKCFPGDLVKVSFKTERGMYAYCNNKVIPEESNDGKTSIFYTMYSVVQGKNRIVLKVTDFAGNTTTKEIVFASTSTNTINLTLDKPSWDVNFEKQPKLVCAPTATFKDVKLKALNGTTFVPFKPLAPFLGCSVEWNQIDKSVTILQRNGDEIINTIIMWLGKSTALVNGKQVKIGKNDSICLVAINGTTMVPLRFVAENLGTIVSFDSGTKQITLKYSK